MVCYIFAHFILKARQIFLKDIDNVIDISQFSATMLRDIPILDVR